jgi:toxin ParE1/3/4
MRRCEFTPAALRDLRGIHAFIAQDNPTAGAHLISKIERACEGLSEMPGQGRFRSEFAPGLRSFLVSPYLIFYREQADGIEIVRVLHGARDIQASLFE